MKFIKLLSVIFLLCMNAVLFGQNATVMRMTGAKAATVLLPNASDETPLVEGQEVPVGALITVGANTKLFLRTFNGAITTAAAGTVFEIEEVKANADGTETTRIGLRGGDLVANLDPTKKGIHDYRVRTPKGVAAARGTTYSVSVAGTNVLVTVSGGVVSFTVPGVATPVLVNPGQASLGGSTAQPLASVLASASTEVQVLIGQAMQATAAAVATLVGDPNSGVSSTTLDQVVQAAASASAGSNDSGTLVAAVAAAAAQANPAVAQQVVQTAVQATAGSTAANAVATNVVASVARASANATGADVAQTVASLSSAANSASGGTVTVNQSDVTNAVNQSNQPPAPPTTSTPSTPPPPPVIVVPVDNIIVSPSS